MEGGEATAIRSKGRGPRKVTKEVGHTAGKGVCGGRGGGDVCVCVSMQGKEVKILQSSLPLAHSVTTSPSFPPFHFPLFPSHLASLSAAAA